MTREEAIQELEEVNTILKSWSGFTEYPQALYIAINMAIEALSAEQNMIPIKLEKRYPESRDEDITDAFMQGYLKGKADRPQGKWKCMADCGVTECDQCGWSIEEYVGDYNYCPNCGADMRGKDNG